MSADNAQKAEIKRADRDIFPQYPPPGNMERRRKCERKLRLFLETYLPNTFCKKWSASHLKAIATEEKIILDGGMFALAMPRASGKTSISMGAALWALLYGHRRFIVIFAATTELATDNLETYIKRPIATNDLLLEDFRQVCYPVRRLEGNNRKAGGQLFENNPTDISWGSDTLILPTMPDSACDGTNVSRSIVRTFGLTSSFLGLTHSLANDQVIRPDLVVLDDPQNRESAMSVSQCQERAAIILGSVLGLAGPGKSIAAMMPCTVIRKDDLSDRFLDRHKHPEWRGEKTKMIYVWPTHMNLWDQYHEKCMASIGVHGDIRDGTDFYRSNRKVMDEGAKLDWEDRHESPMLSSLQDAMSLYYRSPDSFAAEYQNDPEEAKSGESPVLPKEEIVKKLNNFERGTVPKWGEHLCMFVDVHKDVLFYCVAAFSDKFDGAIIDYGTYPEQNRRHFTLGNVTKTLAMVGPKGAGEEGYIFAGLKALTDLLLAKSWEREDGQDMRIERCLIDAGYKPGVVTQACQQSRYAGVMLPSRGEGIGAARKPISEYSKKMGDKIGFNWWIPRVVDRRAGRHFRIDTNFWKTFVFQRLATPFGDSGCLSLWGHSDTQHALFAEQLTAETSKRKFESGRNVDEYKQQPGRDNHWFDCLVGCAAAASLQGVTLAIPGVRRVASRVVVPKKRSSVRYF